MPAAGRVLGRGAPIALRHVGELVVIEMRLRMHDRAEHAVVDQPLHLDDGRLVAALVADAEHDARLPAGFDRALGIAPRQGKGLFAEHMLAGARHGEHLLGMHRMRRAQDDGVDRGIAEHIGEVRREAQAVLGREALLGRIGLDRHDDPQRIGVLHAPNHVLAPPAEPDDCGADHRCPPGFGCAARPCGPALSHRGRRGSTLPIRHDRRGRNGCSNARR